MKRKFIISGILLIALLVYSIGGGLPIGATIASSLGLEEAKVYSSATLEDEFADATIQ